MEVHVWRDTWDDCYTCSNHLTSLLAASPDLKKQLDPQKTKRRRSKRPCLQISDDKNHVDETGWGVFPILSN